MISRSIAVMGILKYIHIYIKAKYADEKLAFCGIIKQKDLLLLHSEANKNKPDAKKIVLPCTILAYCAGVSLS